MFKSSQFLALFFLTILSTTTNGVYTYDMSCGTTENCAKTTGIWIGVSIAVLIVAICLKEWYLNKYNYTTTTSTTTIERNVATTTEEANRNQVVIIDMEDAQPHNKEQPTPNK